MEEAAHADPGDVYGEHFEIIEQLGRGGYGFVYLARDTLNPKREVVLKLNMKYNSHISECKVLMTLQGRKDVFPAYYGHGTQNDKHWLAIAKLGKSLGQVIIDHRKVFSIRCACMVGL